MRLCVVPVGLWIAACGQEATATSTGNPSSSRQVTATPTPTPFVPSHEELTWARRNLRSEPGHQDLGAALDWVKEVGPPAVSLLDDLVPLLEADGERDLLCAAVVETICALGPKAARAIPALLKVARREELTDEDGRIINQCPRTVDAEIGKFGDAAFPYVYQALGADDWLSRFAHGREEELLARLRRGGPHIEASAVAMARIERNASGVREALIEGHRSGHLTDAVFLVAIQELSDLTQVDSAIKLPDLEPIVADIASQSTDRTAKRDAARMLKLFPPAYPPGFGGPPLLSLRLPPLERATPKSSPKATPKPQ